MKKNETKKDIQGDVMVRPVAALPEGAVKISDNILARGEKSGHHHIVKGCEVYALEDRRFVVAGVDCPSLLHVLYPTETKADHDPITLEPGRVYEVIIQNEFNPFAGVFEQVAD